MKKPGDKQGFRIPSAFSVFGQRIIIEYPADLTYSEDNRGDIQLRHNRIRLQPPSSATPIPQSALEQSFCHELMHCIFYHAERDKLFKDEALVNLCGNILHQVLTSAEYEPIKE